MLRNRYRSVTRKQQAVMDEQSFHSSSSPTPTKPISSFFGSPRFFNGFLSKSPFESEIKSPNSVLDTKPFSPISNPFGYYQNLGKLPTTFPGNKHPKEKSDPDPEPEPTGLALIDSLIDQNPDENTQSKPNITSKVLFGSKLKVQIPQFPPSDLPLPNSPKSPADFGIKTRNSKCSSPFGSGNTAIQTRPPNNGCLSLSEEMEISEDYTCVISHGPNPRTTHIYDDCIVESCCGGSSSSRLKNGFGSFSNKPNPPSKNFLSFCYTCKNNLGPGKDIFMYRGDKAFCSSECRLQEMICDGEKDLDIGG